MDIKKVITLVFLGVLSLNISVFGYDPLFDEIYNADFIEVQKVINNLTNKEEKEFAINEKDSLGTRPLIEAILEHGRHTRGKRTKSANELYKIIIFLIDNGADVNLTADVSPQSPLLSAVIGDNEKIFKILLNNDAKIDDVYGNNRNTVLISAAFDTNIAPQWLRLILKKKANIDARNALGDTALIEAVRSGNVDKVKILKCAGADIFIKNNNGLDAYTIALNNNLTTIMNILMSGITEEECKDI